MKKIGICLVVLLTAIILMGCKEEETAEKKVRDLDFTVVATANIPDELITVLEEEKTQPFYRAYSDGEYMYLCVGYGEQATGGYSITVNELYLTDENIYVDTTLIGPGPEEKTADSKSYPYIVLCTEYMDLPVVFE